MPVSIDLKGQRFGRLTVLERDCLTNKRNAYWICICECGNYSSVASGSLKNGTTKSCGCLNKEPTVKPCYRHGQHRSRLYGVWHGMKSRCYNPNLKYYKHYGGRGITVCEEWRNDFSTFYDWAMANGYDENAERGECTLDRINVNGNYEPSNCRWASVVEQANNRRGNRMVAAFGETKTMAQWARDAGISYNTFAQRIEDGWSPEEALTKKIAP